MAAKKRATKKRATKKKAGAKKKATSKKRSTKKKAGAKKKTGVKRRAVKKTATPDALSYFPPLPQPVYDGDWAMQYALSHIELLKGLARFSTKKWNLRSIIDGPTRHGKSGGLRVKTDYAFCAVFQKRINA